MRRIALETLKKWKSSPNHKPMIIHGARQVGKTWLMKEFGRLAYKNTVYVTFENNRRIHDLFSMDLDVRRIVSGLELETGIKIDPQDTLIIFDEIQECPNALTSLKYFNENLPEYDIVAAGSLLGVALHTGTSFPVGKVEFMDLRPLGFSEFLLALGEEQLCELLTKKTVDWDLVTVFREKFLLYLRMYFYVGGMPEVVAEFAKEKDFNVARKIQERILDSYQQDFSKHIPVNHIQKVRQIWDSIPAQLARENKKFMYKDVQKGASTSTFELSIGWLESCGLIHKINRVSKPAQPLKAYENTGAFKLFLCDIGLLSAMSVLNPKIILQGDALFTEFKGALTEQYACQEMKLLDDSVSQKPPHISYWTNDHATAEIDFVLQINSHIIPVEVKAGVNLKAKSLSVYREKFQPNIEIRTSQAPYKKNGNLYDIPLYALRSVAQITSEP